MEEMPKPKPKTLVWAFHPGCSSLLSLAFYFLILNFLAEHFHMPFYPSSQEAAVPVEGQAVLPEAEAPVEAGNAAYKKSGEYHFPTLF
jgi:hypothetical protein